MSIAAELTQEQTDELIADVFKTVDADGKRYLAVGELGAALESVGIKLPAYQVRDLVKQSGVIKREDKLDLDEFKQLYSRLKHDLDLGSKFKKAVTKREGVDLYGGMSSTSAEGTTHTVLLEEQIAFSNWINRNLASDPDCAKLLPIDPNTKDLYVKCADGILLCKLVNRSQPGTVDERAINRGKLNIYHIHENLTLALNSAQAIGCNIVNIGPDDIQAGKPHLVLGLLWQIIRIGLLSVINVYDQPGLAALLEEGETLEDLLKLSPEQILLRWINFHLRKSGCGRHVTNLSSDIKDSVVYTHLLNQIAPQEFGVTTGALHEPNVTARAELMLQEADKLGCRSFVSALDVVNGNAKLNLAFVANLFNNHPGLEPRDDVSLEAVREETREEKTYRNWMNSMGVSPYVSRLYSDLSDGIVIFQLYDIIRPGCVDWSRVITKFNRMRMMMEKIENCNYAVELGKQCKFSLVGIAGKDIYDGNETLTLALIWQLMKAYTLSILAKLAGREETSAGHTAVEKEIVAWTNSKLLASGKTTKINSFNDQTISDSVVVLDLIDAVKSGSVNYELVKQATTDEAEKLENAQYAISTARKIGARVYALPEDIVHVKAKMVMTVFACLMIRDLQRQSQIQLEAAAAAAPATEDQ